VRSLTTHVRPEPLPDPVLAAMSAEAAALLGWSTAELATDEALCGLLAGTALPAHWRPWACNYAGHQFGHFQPQLGDGRAMTVAEAVTPRGDVWEIQLKGRRIVEARVASAAPGPS